MYNQNREVMETSEQRSKTFQDLSYEWNSCVNVGNCHFYDDDKKQSAMMLIRSGRAATRTIQTLQGCEIQTWSWFLRYAVTLNVYHENTSKDLGEKKCAFRKMQAVPVVLLFCPW